MNTMENPYQYLQPVSDPQNFYGRQSLVSKVYSRIGADRPQSISLVGDPRIGKTSFIWYVLHEKTKHKYLRDAENYIYIYIPISTEKNLNFENFSQYFCQIIYREVQKHMELKKYSLKYDTIKHIVEELHQRGKKIILFFDNFNLVTLNKSIPLEFFSFLRSLANNYNLAYITTSYQDLQQLCSSKDIEESPFFNIFTNMTIKPLEREEARQLILEPARRHNVSLEKEAEEILSVAGTFPLFLQLACHLIYKNKITHPQSDAINDTNFLNIYRSSIRPYFQEIWQHFSGDEKLIFQLILENKKLPAHLQYLIRNLERKNYIITRNGSTRLFSPTFEQFLTQEIRVSSGSEKHRRAIPNILNRLVGYIRRWTNSH